MTFKNHCVIITLLIINIEFFSTQKGGYNLEKNILSKIEANISVYSGIERRIAEKILENPKKFITYSMTDLSKEAGVSQGSINNFSKKVSGNGFSALKLMIAQQLPLYTEEQFTSLEDGDSIKDILRKSKVENEKALKNTIILNNEHSLESAVNKILTAKKIELYGIARSGIIAKDFFYQLLQLGLPATYVDDVLLSPVSSSMLDENCVVIAVSSTGRTKDIIDAVKIAKENNVHIICITANKNSPLAKLADDVLLAMPSGETVTGTANEVRLSQMFLTNCICSHLNYILDKDGKKHYYKVKNILDSHSVND